MAAVLGIGRDWAYVNQVHGSTVVVADRPGLLAEADAIVTDVVGLPITVATADCVPVIIEGPDAVGVIHVGWRGAAAGVVPAAVEVLGDMGSPATKAAVGPGIGPCCYEVGDDVLERFGGFDSQTTWGTPSVDLPAFVASELGELEVWRSDRCTYTSTGLHSYRRDRTTKRQVAVGWLPRDGADQIR